MSISHYQTATSSNGISTILCRWPDVVDGGEALLHFLVSKYPSVVPVPADPTGLAALGHYVGGAGAAGIDSGNVRGSVFFGVAAGTEDGASESIDLPGGNSAHDRMFSYTRSAGSAWSVAISGGSQNVGSASWDVTGAESITIEAGHVVVVAALMNRDAYVNANSETLIAGGCTFSAVTDRSATGTTQGDDCYLQIFEFTCTAGSFTGTPRFTVTFGGTAATPLPAGVVAMVRLGEVVGGGGTSIDTSDSGTGTEAIAISVAAGLADTASGSDAFAGAASVPLADAGAGTDSLLATTSLLVADAGLGLEAPQLSVMVPLAELGAAIEALQVLSASLITLLDSGIGSDAIAAQVAALVGDAGAGVEAPLPNVALSLADLGAAVESLQLLTATLVTLLDSGAGSDAIAAQVATLVNDAGLGSAAAGVAAALGLLDAGAGTDAPTVNVQLALAELGTGSEALALLTAVLKTVADAAVATDSLGAIQVSLSLSDSAAGAELLAIAAMVNALDAGSGVDVAMHMTVTSGVRIVAIRFSTRSRAITFSLH